MLPRSQDEIRQLARAMRDTAGNLPPLPGIFPDTMAPVVRTAEDGVRELATMRWVLARFPTFKKSKTAKAWSTCHRRPSS